MRRRRSSAQSSFDLFLDTVCNTFGGILFIAILIAVQIRQTDATQHQESPPSSEAILYLQNELEALAADAKAAQGVLDAVRTSMPAPTNPADMQTIENYERSIEELKALSEIKTELLAQYLSIMQSIAELEETQRTSEKRLAELELSEPNLVEIVQEFRAAQNRLNKSIDDAQKAENRLEGEIAKTGERVAAADSNVRAETLHLPKLQDADQSKGIRLLVLHNNGLYPLDTSGGVMNPPRPGSVIRVDGTDKSREAIKKLLINKSPQSTDLAIFVYPESFGRFHAVRDCAIAAGFQYEIVPTDHFNHRFSSGIASSSVAVSPPRPTPSRSSGGGGSSPPPMFYQGSSSSGSGSSGSGSSRISSGSGSYGGSGGSFRGTAASSSPPRPATPSRAPSSGGGSVSRSPSSTWSRGQNQ